MYILLKDALLDTEGNLLFHIVEGEYQEDVTGRGHTEASVKALRSGQVIPCTDLDDARACLQALAHEANAQEWNSRGRCFVSVRYRPDDVGAILQYMTRDAYPASLVRDAATLVSLMNWSEESLTEITEFVRHMREKYP